MGARKATEIADKLFGDNWPKRRRYLAYALIWSAANVEWLIWRGLDVMTLQLSMTLVAVIFALLTTYVFGAVIDDHQKRLRLPRLSVPGSRMNAASEPPCEPETPSQELAFEPEPDSSVKTTTTVTETRP